MFQLTDPNNNFVLCWSPRCACTTAKAWWRYLRGDADAVDIKSLHKETPIDLVNPDSLLNYEKRIIITRNPVDRFVSVLNHEVIFRHISSVGTDRIDELLSVLETTDLASYPRLPFNHHISLQCCVYDEERIHERTDMSKYFNHIIKLENGDVAAQLNKVVDSGRDFYLNHTANNNFTVSGKKVNTGIDFSYTDIPVIRREDLKSEYVSRIKSLYSWDYKWFYPEL